MWIFRNADIGGKLPFISVYVGNEHFVRSV